MGVLILIVGFTKKINSGLFLLTLVTSTMTILIFVSIATSLNKDPRWRARDTVFIYERALAFNQSQLRSRFEGRQFYRSYSRLWRDGGSVSLSVVTSPNYRFTEEQLEQLSLIASEIENIYEDEDAPYPSWEELIWIRYSLDTYWLRTYLEENTFLATTRDAGLSAIYGVVENIAVVEVRFPSEMTRNVLRLPLIDQHGELHEENFALALQLQQLMISELHDTEETRPFELAREMLADL
jgi:hypothetical protein